MWFSVYLERAPSPSFWLCRSKLPVIITFGVRELEVPKGAIPAFYAGKGAKSPRVLDAVADTAAVKVGSG